MGRKQTVLTCKKTVLIAISGGRPKARMNRGVKNVAPSTPEAIADAQSIAPEDFVATDLVFPDRTGEIYQVTYSPNHRWFYFPEMRRDEALLLKCYDSATDGRARFTAHTAFDDPTAPEDAAPRESIEVRTLISYTS